jgi:hypothetical protein
MNERIRKLAEQAHDIEKNTLYFICPTIGSDVAKQVSREEEIRLFNYEKFAELIIRECVASIEKTIDTNCETDSEKMGCEFAITDLKKHFGVE